MRKPSTEGLSNSPEVTQLESGSSGVKQDSHVEWSFLIRVSDKEKIDVLLFIASQDL